MLPHPHPRDDHRSALTAPLAGEDRAGHGSGPGVVGTASVVHIDCDDCAVQGLRCGDCVVPLLLGSAGSVDSSERAALDALADSGLVPRLQLVALGLPRVRSGASAPEARSAGQPQACDTAPPAL